MYWLSKRLECAISPSPFQGLCRYNKSNGPSKNEKIICYWCRLRTNHLSLYSKQCYLWISLYRYGYVENIFQMGWKWSSFRLLLQRACWLLLILLVLHFHSGSCYFLVLLLASLNCLKWIQNILQKFLHQYTFATIWLLLDSFCNIPWPLVIFLLLFKTFGGKGSWTTNTRIWSAIPRSLTHSTNVSKLYSSPGTSMGTLIIFFEIEYSLSSQ